MTDHGNCADTYSIRIRHDDDHVGRVASDDLREIRPPLSGASGLGLEAVRALVSAGAQVIVPARSREGRLRH